MAIGSDTEALRARIAVVAGMPRSGTTFLYHTLGAHPAMFVPFIKETDYFSVNHDLGPRWYLGLFREMLPHQVGFDISPSYFVDPSAPDRMLRFNRKVKVVLAVRDPAEFAASLYCHLGNAAWRMPPFEAFIERYEGKFGPSRICLELRKYTVPKALEAYREAFGDNLLFFSFDLFRKSPLSVLQAVESFVGAPRHFSEGTFENFVVNAAHRRNLRLFGYLMGRLKRTGRFAFITNASLRRMLQAVRKATDRMSGKGYRPSRIGRYPQETMRTAEAAFADQRAQIAEIFAAARMQLGSGAPFP